jgi:hypothetical protein
MAVSYAPIPAVRVNTIDRLNSTSARSLVEDQVREQSPTRRVKRTGALRLDFDRRLMLRFAVPLRAASIAVRNPRKNFFLRCELPHSS